MGYAPGRSYSKELDQVLKPRISLRNSQVVAQNTILSGILKMMARDRIDFTLGYAHEAAYISHSNKFESDFISLPIQGANKLIPVHVGCPKNSWGQAIIRRLNIYFQKARHDEQFYDAYLQWLEPETRASYPNRSAEDIQP